MSDKYYLGSRAARIDTEEEQEPISCVIINADSENAYVAGDETGRTLPLHCSWATQTMADSVLSKVRGVIYRPYSADDALLDPAVELGDYITLGDIQSVLARSDELLDHLYSADISAPGGDEIEDEYPYLSTKERQAKREIAKTRSLISKTAEEIRLSVENDLEEMSSSISTRLDSIKMEVSSENGSTTFTLTDNRGELSTQTLDLNVKAVNITGKLTAEQIETNDLKVKAANVTGTLTIGQLPNNVAETSDIPTKISQLSNDSGYTTELGVTTIIDGTVTTDYVNALGISVNAAKVSGVLNANLVSVNGLLHMNKTDVSGTASGYVGINTSKSAIVLASADLNTGCIVNNTTAKLSYQESKMIWVHTGGCYSSEAMQIYSDESLKNTINYDMEPFEVLHQSLKPCSYLLNNEDSGRLHWGFIAQDAKKSVESAGIDSALVGYDGKYYSIAYTELIALNTHMIHKLMARIDELERRYKVNRTTNTDLRIDFGSDDYITLRLNFSSGVIDSFRIYSRRPVPITIKAVKLEFGDHQTLAHQDADGNWVLNEIADYGAELDNCKRYYRLWTDENARTEALKEVGLMRIAAPATGTLEIGGETCYYATADL